MVFSYDYGKQKKGRQKKCTAVAGHVNVHASALEQYRRHRQMQYVQGYPGSHWMPPSSNYLLCIAPAAARATENKTTKKKWTNFAGHFDGRGGVPVKYRAHCPMEEVQGFDRSHWMLPLGKYSSQNLEWLTLNLLGTQ